ncbi:MAG: acyltransferase family protein, partial [Pirellulales bacterium]
MKNSRESIASERLDWIRGIAAFAVLIYHIRYRFFFDYSEVPHTLSTNLFYTLTAFGHDAVMVFFVLSGYFISESVRRDCKKGRWSWIRYLTNRVTRLYVVLIPCLLLT